jgi:uncharacterized linocin/CFP29 family protein
MSILAPEQYEYIDTQIAAVARQTIIGRKLFPRPFGPLGFGKQVVSYDVLSEVKKGRIDLMWGAGFSAELIGQTRTKLGIPVLHSEFRINRRDLEASKTEGLPLDLSCVDAAIYAVARKEDDLLLQGWTADGTNYDIVGLYQGAANDENTNLPWPTVAANILTSINNAIALLVADNIFPPYNLTVHPDQYHQLFQLIANTPEWYFNKVKERIGGDIFQSPAMTAGKGMLSAVPNPSLFDFALGIDMLDESEELPLSEGKDLFGVVYECLVPRIKAPNAICKLSDIGV